MNKIEKKLYKIISEEETVKNKQTGNVYTVKTFDPAKHDRPTPAEVEKAKIAHGGELPTSDTPTPKQEPSASKGVEPKKAEPVKISASGFKSSAEKRAASSKKSKSKESYSDSVVKDPELKKAWSGEFKKAMAANTPGNQEPEDMDDPDDEQIQNWIDNMDDGERETLQQSIDSKVTKTPTQTSKPEPTNKNKSYSDSVIDDPTTKKAWSGEFKKAMAANTPGSQDPDDMDDPDDEQLQSWIDNMDDDEKETIKQSMTQKENLQKRKINKIESKLYNLINLISEKQGEIVKNKKTGNVYMVKTFDPGKHDKPSPAEVEKTKAANGGKIPTSDTSSPKPVDGSPKSPKKSKVQPTKISAADFKSDAEKKGPKGVVTGDKLKDLMPGMDTTKKSINDIPAAAKKEAVTMIDKIANDLIKAKETGEKAPNTNLCVVTVPGTNLYCDGNKNIPRDQMPQFRGKPEPGSEADKMPRDKNGEVETSHIFDKMLADQGIKVSEATPVPPDSLKATQSELVGPKVVGMMGVLDKDCNNQKCDEKDQQDYKNITDPIYVSNDGYVVDGHHRWAAITSHNIKNPDKQIPMNVRVIDDKIDSIIPKANKFAQDIGIAPKSGKEGTKGGPPAAQTKPMAENKRIKLSSLFR